MALEKGVNLIVENSLEISIKESNLLIVRILKKRSLLSTF